MIKTTRTFTANEGESSIGKAGPDAIETDLDNLYGNSIELDAQAKELQMKIDNIVAGGTIPLDHSSTSAIYGVGTDTKNGHVKVINDFTRNVFNEGEALSAHQGYKIIIGDIAVGKSTKLATARTVNGVSFDGTQNIIVEDNTKAPTNHASADATYGIGSSANYGHCKVINDLTHSSYADGNAASAYQAYLLGLYAPSKVGDIKATAREIEDATWKKCNGRHLSKASYPSLFSAIGGKYGYSIGTKTVRSFPLTGNIAFISNGGSTIVAYHFDNGLTEYAYSADGGVTWAVGNLSGNIQRISYGNGVFALVTVKSYILSFYTSTNGVSWTKKSDYSIGSPIYASCLKYVNGYWYCSYCPNGGQGALLRSADLINWSDCFRNGALNFNYIVEDIAYGNSKYIIQDAYSTDGVNFTVNSASNYNLEFFNGKFFKYDANYGISYSTDGLTNWSPWVYLNKLGLLTYNNTESASLGAGFCRTRDFSTKIGGFKVVGEVLYYVCSAPYGNSYEAKTFVYATLNGTDWYIVSDYSEEDAASSFAFLDTGTNAIIYRDNVFSTLSGSKLPDFRIPCDLNEQSFIKVA